MRLFLFALCLSFASSVSAADRDAGPPSEKGKEKGTEQFLDGLTESLDLNASQAEKVKVLTKDYFDRTKAKTEEAKALREKLTALEKDLSEQTRRLEEAVRGELTFEQKDRFDMLRIHRRQPPREMREMREMREKRMERMMERRGGGGGKGGSRGGPPDMDDEGGPGRFPPEMWHEGRGGQGAPGKRGEESPDGD
ncbi:MAG: hypothetical protein FD126_1670 [Elusimicrobia bacterium]|nr:MAG: hypothetical protein FD126_1670 [Elusimicrobiota bacterium]